MRITFEEWLRGQDLPAESFRAFEESFRSYRAQAYRAALLFSYSGWSLWLRRRLLESSNPAGLPKPEWKSTLEALRAEEKWESTVFQCTQQYNKGAFFNVSPDLRRQVAYWKDRRNDCAHFKVNSIEPSHVEAFWQFVRSNIGRFVPNGSAEDLLGRIRQHFDPNTTPPGADLTPLVERIQGAVEQEALSRFFSDVPSALTDERVGLVVAADEARFFEAVLSLTEPPIIREAAGFLLSKPSVLTAVLRISPQLVQVYAGKPRVIRRLWRQLLFEERQRDLPIYSSLVRNNLIPADQLEDAHSWIVEHLNDDIPGAEDSETLRRAGFWRAYEATVFEKRRIDDFGWGNRNAKSVRWYVETNTLSDIAVEAICSTFAREPFPFAVRDALAELFMSNVSKRTEMEEVAERIGCVAPADLGFHPKS